MLRAHLQETLQTRRGVLRPLTFVAVRQVERESAQASPLDLAGDDELVDDHLRTVGEIAELRFPDHHRRGVRGGVSVLESEYRLLGEQRVDYREVSGLRRHILERNVRRAVIGVMQHGMTVRERAATAV